METHNATELTADSVKLNGRITNCYGQIEEYGFYFGTNMETNQKIVVGVNEYIQTSFSEVITGLEPGTYFYKAFATNATGTGYGSTEEFSFADPDATITLTSPNGSETWETGTKQSISWNYTGRPGSYIKIELLKNGVVSQVLSSSKLIGSNGSGTYLWTIPATQASDNDYSIRVSSTTNSNCMDTSDNNFSIAGPTITLAEPNGDETWTAGTTQTIQWNYTGNPGKYVKITLYKDGVLNRTITTRTSAGSGGSGSYAWKIPAKQADGNDYVIRVTSTTNSACTDTSDNFRIAGPTITLAAPNGNEAWAAGTTQTIQWDYTGNPGSYVKVTLYKDGVLNRTIASRTPAGSGGSGSYAWKIPATQTGGNDYKVKVTSTTNSACTDTSDKNFSIAGTSITLTKPNGGETWAAGTTQTIQWDYTGNPGDYVKIALYKDGVLNRTIATRTPAGSGGSGSYDWEIPATQANGDDYFIRVTSAVNSSFKDTSELFTITR